MSSIYTGRIKYPAKAKEYDWGEGPRMRTVIGIIPEDPEAPGQNDSGIVNIYKDTGSNEALYMDSLEYEDEVTMVWTQGKGGRRKGFYTLDIPRGWSKPQQNVSSQPTREPSKEQETRQYRPINTEAAMRAVGDAVDLLLYCWETVEKAFGGDELSEEVLEKLAVTVFLYAKKHAHTTASGSAEQSLLDPYTEYVLYVQGENDKVAAVLDRLVEHFDLFDSLASVKSELKALGLSGDDITNDPESWGRIWAIVEKYAELLSEPGKTVTKAREELRNDDKLFPLFEEDDTPF